MTLERLTERLEEEKAKIGKVDGRRFNSRSRTKMFWEMRNIERAHAAIQRKKKNLGPRSMYTPEELQEYKEIENRFREEQVSSREKGDPKLPAFTSTSAGTPAGTPEPGTSPVRCMSAPSMTDSTVDESETRRKSMA